MARIFPSATKTWHNDTYASISPENSNLSCRDKTVIITGGGGGIGRETALAYATAGAKHIVLLDLVLSGLENTKNILPSSVECSIHPTNVVDEEKLVKIAKEVGKWDVLILGAGSLSGPTPLSQAETADWWQDFETNVKGAFVTVKVFSPTANPAHASIIGLTSAFTLPTATFQGLSSYITSKTAKAKLLEFVAAENSHIFVAGVQPGFIETEIFKKGGGKTGMDTLQLPAHFMVWLTSPEGAFLRGRSVWANWDVEELKQRANEIKKGQELTVGVFDWDRYKP